MARAVTGSDKLGIMSSRRTSFGLFFALVCLIVAMQTSFGASTTTGSTPTTTPPQPAATPAPTTTAKPQLSAIEIFFQNDNNKAMFIVLPIMVLVYGGCSAIYCIYKCRKYCKRQARRKERAKLREQFNGLNGPETSRCLSSSEGQSSSPEENRKPKTVRSLFASKKKPDTENLDENEGAERKWAMEKKEAQSWKQTPKRTPSEDDGMAFNILPHPATPEGQTARSYQQKEGFGVRNPGYVPTEDEPSMGLIDIQLKEALAMIDSVVRKPMEAKSRPDIEVREGENEEPIKKRRKMKQKVFTT